MNEEIVRSKRCYVKYPDKGVEIVIPPQDGRKSCIVEEMIPTEKLVKSDGFTPIREAINFKVKIDPTPVQSTNTFYPPLMLKVKFTFDDLKVVGDNRDQLKLAYLDENGQWILLETTRKDYDDVKDWMDLPPEGDTWAGHFIAKISEWGDPSVSIGH